MKHIFNARQVIIIAYPYECEWFSYPLFCFLFAHTFLIAVVEDPYSHLQIPLHCCPECTAKLLGNAEKNSLSSAVRITHCLTFNYTLPCWISMCLGKTFKVVSLSFRSLICKTRRILLVFPAGILNGLISWGLQSVHRVASWLNLCSAWSSFFSVFHSAAETNPLSLGFFC